MKNVERFSSCLYSSFSDDVHLSSFATSFFNPQTQALFWSKCHDDARSYPQSSPTPCPRAAEHTDQVPISLSSTVLLHRLATSQNANSIHIYLYSSHSELPPAPGIMTFGSSFIMLSASPTCFRSVTSRFLRRERAAAMLRFVLRILPLNSGGVLVAGRESFVATDCHCRGSEEDDRRFRWR